jgi:hypothetical protein
VIKNGKSEGNDEWVDYDKSGALPYDCKVTARLLCQRPLMKESKQDTIAGQSPLVLMLPWKVADPHKTL